MIDSKSLRAPMARLPLAVALLVASASAPAIDVDGNYAVWGVGQASCHQFDKAYAAAELDAYKAYLAGYLTAYNALVKDVFQVTGRNSATDNLAAIHAHCAGNPMDSFERGIQSLIQANAGRKTDGAGAWGRAAPAQ